MARSAFLIFAGSFGKASPFGGDENDVRIPDANLRAVIADSLGKTSDEPITRTELATLTELKAHEANIGDLSGLQFAANLESLWLTYNGFSDVSPLCDLTRLKDLVLFGNSISDLSPLSGLTQLTGLNLNDNRVSDLSPLKKLKHFWLLNNRISDMSTLSGLTDLAGLEIGGTGLTDLSVIAGLTNLTELGLSDNQISDISAVSGLIKLKYLGLSDNCVAVLTALSGLTNLTHVNLTHNRVSDFSPLNANPGFGSGDVVDAGSSHTLQANYLNVDQQRIRPAGRRGGIAALAYADFNGDGGVDIVVDDAARNLIWKNDGTGTFRPR